MKKLLLAAVLGLGTMTAIQAQEISFEQDVIDYGEVAKGSNGERVFVFQNTGDKPLLIKNVKTSCGCTVADYPKTAVAPGEKAEIKVGYDTNRLNNFSKTIEVYSNAVENGRKLLRIKGVVLDK